MYREARSRCLLDGNPPLALLHSWGVAPQECRSGTEGGRGCRSPEGLDLLTTPKTVFPLLWNALRRNPASFFPLFTRSHTEPPGILRGNTGKMRQTKGKKEENPALKKENRKPLAENRPDGSVRIRPVSSARNHYSLAEFQVLKRPRRQACEPGAKAPSSGGPGWSPPGRRPCSRTETRHPLPEHVLRWKPPGNPSSKEKTRKTLSAPVHRKARIRCLLAETSS